MPVHNADIAAIFNDIADLLDIQGGNPFRIRAYRNAARTVGSLMKSLEEMVNEGQDLSELPGIGKDLAGKIEEIVRTGSLVQLKELQEKMPSGLIALMNLPALGPKRVKAIHQALGVKNLEDLKKAMAAGKVGAMPGFGKKIEQKITEGLQRLESGEGLQRIKLSVAEEICDPLVAYLRQAEGVLQVEPAGSYRRRRETVADLDILVVCTNPAAFSDHFARYYYISQVISQGDTLISAILRNGLRVDVRMVPRESLGAALVYFTGSKSHNIAIRKIAVRKQLKINEYGVFKGARSVAGKTEEEVYAQIGLRYIEPELREDRGEVAAAQENRLPKLIHLSDIQGDLQSHTKATDGKFTIQEMAAAARALGYRYLAITDHSKRVAMAKGLDAKRLAAQIQEIDSINRSLNDFVVLKSIEVDILENGTLDLPDDILKELDIVLCSAHYYLDLPKDKQTARILRAMDNPHFHILGHPTGRLIGEREPCEIDLERVMRGAKERGCFVELNAQPDRLDLSDIYCQMAKEMGLKIAISTDAHSKENLRYMKYGIAQARRGWIEKNDVINARPVEELLKLIKRK